MSEISFWRDKEALRPIKTKSKRFPEHDFRLGYMDLGRGEGSYIRVIHDAIRKSPLDVFRTSPEAIKAIEDVEVFQPDYAEVYRRLGTLIGDYEKHLAMTPVFARFVDAGMYPAEALDTEEQALVAYKQGFGQSITLTNLQRIIPANTGFWCCYSQDPDGNPYLQGLEIIMETLVYVQNHQEPMWVSIV